MPEPSMALFATVRAPVWQTSAFVNYHLNTGVDHIYLFFDDPDDPAVDALKGETRITCTRCDASHWDRVAGNKSSTDLNINLRQGINSKIALEKARQAGHTWICHLDADELLYAPGGLRQAVTALSHDVQIAKAPVLEVVAEKPVVQMPFHELHYFKIAPEVLPGKKFFYLSRREIPSFLIGNSRYYLRKLRAGLGGNNKWIKDYIQGHMLGKSIVRTSLPIRMFYSHFPIPSKKERIPLNLLADVSVLHYYITDFDQWMSKYYGMYRDIQLRGIKERHWSKRRIRQYFEFVNVFSRRNEQELVELFESTCLIPPLARNHLQKIGLLSEIHLSPDLFEPPK